MRDRRMLFHRQVCIAFIKEHVFTHKIGLGKALFHVAEFKVYFLVNVAALAIVVNARLINHHCFFDTRDGL